MSLALVVSVVGYAAPEQETVKPGPSTKKLEAMVASGMQTIPSRQATRGT